MSTQQLYRIAAILVGIAALFIILERLWGLVTTFQDIILLFALAWLVSFTLAPVIEWLKRPFYPEWIYRRLRAHIPPLDHRHLFPHGMAVALVYVTMIVLLIVSTSGLIPEALTQGKQFSDQLPTLPDRFPKLVDDLEAQLATFGLHVDLRVLYEVNVAPQINVIGANFVKDLLNALTVVAATVSNLLLVIILSLYMNLGGHTLSEQVASLIPRHYRKEVLVFAASVNRTFGGFIRGQLIQALLVGGGTAAVMIVMGLKAVVLGATLAALLMLIPIIGALLAILPPVLIAIFQGSLTSAFVVFVLLFVFQQIVVNAIMPKILADSVGLHPLLIFAALLLGIKIGGIWGAFFGIPIAGVLYAMTIHLVRRVREAGEEQRTEQINQVAKEEVRAITTHQETRETEHKLA